MSRTPSPTLPPTPPCSHAPPVQCAAAEGRSGLGFTGPMLSALGFFWWTVYAATISSAAGSAGSLGAATLGSYRWGAPLGKGGLLPVPAPGTTCNVPTPTATRSCMPAHLIHMQPRWASAGPTPPSSCSPSSSVQPLLQQRPATISNLSRPAAVSAAAGAAPAGLPASCCALRTQQALQPAPRHAACQPRQVQPLLQWRKQRRLWCL